MSSSTPPAVCPVKHDATSTPSATCPVPHASSPSSSSSSSSSSPSPSSSSSVSPPSFASLSGSGTCPVPHASRAAVAARMHPERSEPSDGPNRPISATATASAPAVSQHGFSDRPDPTSTDHNDIIPAGKIPAAGRGNSDDGAHWQNPSANQLYRALARADKPIEHKDAYDVALVHEYVTEGSWAAVMEYEKLHSKKCPNPTLARFQGQDGNYSLKARFVHMLSGRYPFDRHDWIVDRCGVEKKYIIDYWDVEEVGFHGETQTAYYIDARPAPTPSGMIDRAHLAIKKWWAGESVW